MDPGRGVKAEKDVAKLDSIQTLANSNLAVDAVSSIIRIYFGGQEIIVMRTF